MMCPWYVRHASLILFNFLPVAALALTWWFICVRVKGRYHFCCTSSILMYSWVFLNINGWGKKWYLSQRIDFRWSYYSLIAFIFIFLLISISLKSSFFLLCTNSKLAQLAMSAESMSWIRTSTTSYQRVEPY